MLIQYNSPEDALAAQLINRTIGDRITTQNFTPSTLNDDLLIIGGDQANTTFANFRDAGLFPTITPGTPGKVYHATQGIYDIWAVAGDLRGDTIAAAEYVMLNGLPGNTVTVGTVSGLSLLSIPITANQSIVNAITSNLEQIRSDADIGISLFGLNADAVYFLNGKIEFLIRGDTAVVSSQATAFEWIGIIAGILIFASAIVVGWPAILLGGVIIGISLISNVITSFSPAQAAAAEISVFDHLIAQGVSPDIAAKAAQQVTAAQSGGGFFDDLKKYAAIALVVIGGLMIYQSTRK